jgi:hypothetical protein
MPCIFLIDKRISLDGASNPNTKLTQKDVDGIRSEYSAIPRGRFRARRGSVRALAARYGVTRDVVSRTRADGVTRRGDAHDAARWLSGVDRTAAAAAAARAAGAAVAAAERKRQLADLVALAIRTDDE